MSNKNISVEINDGGRNKISYTNVTVRFYGGKSRSHICKSRLIHDLG